RTWSHRVHNLCLKSGRREREGYITQVINAVKTLSLRIIPVPVRTGVLGVSRNVQRGNRIIIRARLHWNELLVLGQVDATTEPFQPRFSNPQSGSAAVMEFHLNLKL